MYDSLREILRINHKINYSTVMRTLLYEWYDDDGYLELCANEYCERPIEKGNEIWHTVLFGQEYAFCCDYCVGLGSPVIPGVEGNRFILSILLSA